MIAWRERLRRPTPEAVWCDECLRWEEGDGRFPRVRRAVGERLCSALAAPFYKVAGSLVALGEVFQVARNWRRGEMYVKSGRAANAQ